MLLSLWYRQTQQRMPSPAALPPMGWEPPRVAAGTTRVGTEPAINTELAKSRGDFRTKVHRQETAFHRGAGGDSRRGSGCPRASQGEPIAAATHVRPDCRPDPLGPCPIGDQCGDASFYNAGANAGPPCVDERPESRSRILEREGDAVGGAHAQSHRRRAQTIHATIPARRRGLHNAGGMKLFRRGNGCTPHGQPLKPGVVRPFLGS